MSESRQGIDTLVRAFLGAFAGAVLGLVVLAIVFHSLDIPYAPIRDSSGLLLMGIGVGALAGAVFGWVAGGWKLRGRAVHVSTGQWPGSSLEAYVASSCQGEDRAEVEPWTRRPVPVQVEPNRIDQVQDG